MKKRKMLQALMWLMIVIIVFILGSSFVSKVFEEERQVLNAQKWGFPYELMYLIGAYEVLVIRFMISGPRRYGMFALTLQMLVAIIVHLLHGEAVYTLLNIGLIAFACGVYSIDKRLKADPAASEGPTNT